jgi:hypothetical protein
MVNINQLPSELYGVYGLPQGGQAAVLPRPRAVPPAEGAHETARADSPPGRAAEGELLSRRSPTGGDRPAVGSPEYLARRFDAFRRFDTDGLPRQAQRALAAYTAGTDVDDPLLGLVGVDEYA